MASKIWAAVCRMNDGTGCVVMVDTRAAAEIEVSAMKVGGTNRTAIAHSDDPTETIRDAWGVETVTTHDRRDPVKKAQQSAA